ncbi:MAG TPA: helix-turn-helix domain-containing protein [Caulobacteraceae bacterium]|jgi:transposase-like protein|nr:helix-turn-helix domain-containing protein [Caulobacteraceae bacterium]
MSDDRRSFSLQVKREALARLAAGELVSALAAEFGVHRQLIYKWRDAERAGRLGRRRGPPTKAERLARSAGSIDASELELARRRIAELERKIGQQAVDLDFFRGALRRIEGSRQPSEGLGATRSSRRSRR